MLFDLANAASRLAGVSRQLTTFDLAKRTKTVFVERGQTVTLGSVDGTGVITRLWLTFPGWFWQHWNPDSPVTQTILKTLILRIYWDDSKTPAIEAPMGDFFGIGHAEFCHYTALPLGMSSGGFYCYWPMPYRRAFRIEVENRDEKIGTEIFCNVNYQQYEHPDEPPLYFAAQFRTARRTPEQDVTVLDTQGRGRYVGITLSMQGESPNYLAFLEAPEYIFIDEDWDTPRIVGTGLEDYFSGGWYFRDGAFAAPLHGAPIKDALRSMVTMYRFHLHDAINFDRRIRFDFVHPWERDRLKNYWFSSVAYYYTDKPNPPHTPLPDRTGLLSMYRTRDRDHQSIP